MKAIFHAVLAPVVALLVVALPSTAKAKGSQPEDHLAGRIILSDQRLPMRWTSVGSYVGELKKLNKTTLWFDKTSGKVTVQYAAFFARPVNDVQVNLVVYDVTNGAHDNRGTWEQFMTRGQRVLFNSVTLDKEDFAMNKKYLLVIEDRHQKIASGELTLRGEGPHYSGHVEFSDEEAKQKQ